MGFTDTKLNAILARNPDLQVVDDGQPAGRPLTDTLTLVLPGERPPSWNQFWASPHWSARQRIAQRIHARVRAALPAGVAPFTGRVDIAVVAVFDRHPLDSSNICIKPYEDALCGRIIEDDDPLYVRRVSAESRLDRTRPRVEIVITPISDQTTHDTESA